MLRVPFYDAYKQWRNRARKYNLESIVNGVVEVLGDLRDPLMFFVKFII